MDKAETDKLMAAIVLFSAVEQPMNNILSRGGSAGKAWAADLKGGGYTAKQVKDYKTSLAALTTMLKTAKPVLKDFNKLVPEAKKSVAKYPTAKAYRDKVLVKSLASARSWEKKCDAFVTSMRAVLAPFDHPKPPQEPMDTAATFRAALLCLEAMQHLNAAVAKL